MHKQFRIFLYERKKHDIYQEDAVRINFFFLLALERVRNNAVPPTHLASPRHCTLVNEMSAAR